MNKKIIIITILILFLSTTACQAITFKQIESKKQASTNNIEIYFIDDDNTGGPWDGTIYNPFQYISDGLNHANDNDIIYVLNGVYREQLIIDKSLLIIGEDKDNTIIDGEYNEFAIKIISNNVNIEKFTIRNSGGYKDNAGIIIQSNNCEISNCVFYRNRIGTHSIEGDSNKINNCIFHTNGGGVLLEYCENIQINNCEFTHSGIGLQLDYCQNIIIDGSYSHENGIGLMIKNSTSIEITNSALCDNNDNQGAALVYNSNNLQITNCNIYHNGVGFKIYNSFNLVFDHCDFRYTTHFTFFIRENSYDVTIQNSNITDNYRYGVHLSESRGNVINCNIFNNSINGVYIEKTSICKAQHNWWGKITGPFLKGIRFADRTDRHFGLLIVFPWSFKQYKNAGSNWEVDDLFTKTIVEGYDDDPIELPGDDTDNDGVPDWWENEFDYDPLVWDDHANLDEDGDALNNFEECYTYDHDSNPFIKDIFLEFDWMNSQTSDDLNFPSLDLLNEMTARFEEHDIVLHVDTGNLGGGEEIPYINDFNYDVLRDLWWDYFLHNNLNNPRKNIYHYGLICDYGPGNGFAFFGWAHLNSFCISAQYLVDNQNAPEQRELLITHGSMHELGHTLGLFVDDFGGIDNTATTYPFYSEYFKFRNYKSLMSYRYTYKILNYSEGDNGQVDFNDWVNMDFDFFKNTDLSEY